MKSVMEIVAYERQNLFGDNENGNKWNYIFL
jgi:hypothetical protein